MDVVAVDGRGPASWHNSLQGPASRNERIGFTASKVLGALDKCGEYKDPDEPAKYYVSKRRMIPSAKWNEFPFKDLDDPRRLRSADNGVTPGLLTSDARLRSDGGQLGKRPANAKSKGRGRRQ